LVVGFQSAQGNVRKYCDRERRPLQEAGPHQGHVQEGGGLVAAKLTVKERAGKESGEPGDFGNRFVLCQGRRIEVRPSFDSKTLEHRWAFWKELSLALELHSLFHGTTEPGVPNA